VAADLPHIDRDLADRLAGIEQIKDAVARGDAAEARTSFTSDATCWELEEHQPRARLKSIRFVVRQRRAHPTYLLGLCYLY